MSDLANTFTFDGEDFPLRESPSHRSVKKVQQVMVDFMLSKVDVATIDPSKGVQKALQKVMQDDPKIALEISMMEDSLPSDQTIMLCTGWSYGQLTKFADQATEDDYWSLYNRCVEVMGKTAEDFFEVYATNSKSKRQEKMIADQAKIIQELQLRLSSSPDASSLPTSIEP